MSALRRLACRILGHVTPPGVVRAMSIRYCCERCGATVAGSLGRGS